ncbi:MAG: type II toxin-antitoxin system VapC family toxin [Balneolaceae bacterium]
MILLDTHVWLWWLLGDGNLNSTEREALDRLAGKRHISISWVSVWETEMLERKGRITLLPDLTAWMKLAVQPTVTSILPVDVNVVLAQRKLPENLHADPADRLIAATSLLSGFSLATHDSKIRDAGCCSIWQP